MLKKAYLAFLFCSFILLAFAQKPELMIPRGHAESITQLSISPDGKLLASGSWDKSVRIWDIRSGRELKALEGFPNWVNSVAFSPDGKKLVAGSYKELRVYNIGSNAKEVFAAQIHPDDIIALSFSPNGSVLATASAFKKPDAKDGHWFEIKLWNADGMTLIKRIEAQGDLESLRFASNEELLAITKGKIIHINPSAGVLTGTEDFGENMAHYLSPDGKWFVAEGYVFVDGKNDVLNSLSLNDDDTKEMKSNHASLTIINRATKAVAHIFEGQTGAVKTVAFSPDSRYVMSGADSTVYVYDLQTMKRIAKLTDNMSFPSGFAFTPDGKTMFLGNYDQIIRQYNFAQFKMTKQLGGTADIIYNMALSPDAKSLAVMSSGVFLQNGFIQVMNLEKGVLGKSYKSTGRFSDAMQYTPDNKYLVAGNFDRLKVFSTTTGDSVRNGYRAPGTVVAVSADGQQLAISDYFADKPHLFIRTLPTATKANDFLLPEKTKSLLFSKDGKYVYAGLSNGDKVLKVDAQSGAIKQTFYHAGQYAEVTSVMRLLMSKDESTLITGDGFGNIRFWNTESGRETDSIKVATGTINSLIFLPGEKQIAVCTGESAFPDTTIKIVDIVTKKVTAVLTGHNNSPTSLAASPDGKFLFSGSFDRTIRIWNLSTREMVATLVFFGENDWVIVDKAGRFDGTQNGMHGMYYTRGLEVLPLESAFEQFYTPGLLPRLLNNESFAPPIVDINTIKPAPKVKIVYNPKLRNLVLENAVATFDTDNDQVSFSVQASAPDDVIDEIRLYQNGKLITTTSRNLVVDNDKTNEQNKAFTLTLTNGANEIKAVAINSQRTESVPDEIILNYKAKENTIADNTTTLHLMVVAVNTYKNPKYNLNYALADATAFKNEMEKNSSAIYGSVKLHFITDADAMKTNIEKNFKAIEEEAKPQDVFIFYYAGHGVMSDEAKKDFYIVPYDVVQLYGADDALAQKGIPAAELQDFSKNIRAQKQLFILDACQSAGALEAVASRGVAEEKAIAQLARSTGTHWLTASGSEQYAEEFSQLGHGVFTYALLQGLQGGADSGDHQITVNKLKAYLETAVPELTQKYKGAVQYPASYGFGNDFPVEVVK